MKTHIAPLATLVLLVGGLFAPTTVSAQAPSGAAAPESPHRIALIDMAQVFKHYKKFEALREELKGELMQTEEKFKKAVEQVRNDQKELKTFKEGTPEYTTLEKKITQSQLTLQTFQKTQQRTLIRREAEIYKTIYLEVADYVQKYAVHKNYTMVLRFSNEEVNAEDSPEETMRGLNRQVVYHQAKDDITQIITNALNKKYEQTASREPAASPSAKQ